MDDDEYICKECKSTKLEESGNGEICCLECGIIQSTLVIDKGPEWRNWNDGDAGPNNERTGMPPTLLLHDKGLTTDISWQNRDYSGSSMNSEHRKLFRRLRRQHQRTRISSSTERNLAVALGELGRLSSQMALPRTVEEEAAYIYRKAVEKKLVRGRSIEGVVAASLYAACRIRNVPRTLDEVGQFSRTGRKEIGRTFRAVSKELLLRVPPASPSNYIPRFCSLLDLPPEVEAEAQSILSRAENIDLTAGRGPTGIAAASVYLGSMVRGHQRTQREVSVAAGVTEVTIRNRYKELCNALDIDPLDFKRKG